MDILDIRYLHLISYILHKKAMFIFSQSDMKYLTNLINRASHLLTTIIHNVWRLRS